MLLSFTLIGGYCLYISCLLMNFPIHGATFIIASWRHDLSFKSSYAWQSWYPGRYTNPVEFFFKYMFFLLTVWSKTVYKYINLYCYCHNLSNTLLNYFCFYVLPYTIIIIFNTYLFVFSIYISVVKVSPL